MDNTFTYKGMVVHPRWAYTSYDAWTSHLYTVCGDLGGLYPKLIGLIDPRNIHYYLYISRESIFAETNVALIYLHFKK